MSTACDRCKKRSAIYIRYSGQHLCGDHFLDLLGRRVRREVREQGLLNGKGIIGAAVSGGKDSILMLRLLSDILKPIRDVRIVALTVDEGIAGYRPRSIEISSAVSSELSIEHHVDSFEGLFGWTLDETIGRIDIGPCSICGVLRRKALNQMAARYGCGALATGHNLDDTAQTVLMNVLTADTARLKRLGPHTDPIPGLVPRFMPLRTTPENETYLAAYLLDLPIHDQECPYSASAKRGLARDLLLEAEAHTPGTRHSLLKFQREISSHLPRGRADLEMCVRCGDIVISAIGVVCRGCQILEGMEDGDEKEKA
ncbi:MAG: ATP-binding protein [Thermoplasmatota archaeon]